MWIQLTRSFSFEAAHFLEWHPGRCRNLHGHHYSFEVTVGGELTEQGVVVDFDDLAATVESCVLSEFDHRLLNELLANPTAELIAAEIWHRLAPELPGLARIRLYETPDCYVELGSARPE